MQVRGVQKGGTCLDLDREAVITFCHIRLGQIAGGVGRRDLRTDGHNVTLPPKLGICSNMDDHDSAAKCKGDTMYRAFSILCY